MDAHAVAFHPAEPGHLALGKLVDGVSQGNDHIVVTELPQHILCNKLIFKAVVDEVIGRNSAVQQADKQKGLTIVAVKLFIAENGFAKLVIALAKGKKEYDKRQSIKEKDVRREMDRGDW